jgi:hypothetical protein
MNNRVGLIIGVVAACAWPVLAQSGGAGGTDTLSALLVEVRALRVAMERAATTTPEIQLLAARLSVQNERLARATRQADDARQELEQILSQSAALTARGGALEEIVARQTDPARQRDMKQEQAAVKMQLDEHAGQELRLRAREAELANLAAAEQTQWTELNRRIDQLEQDLGARRPR